MQINLVGLERKVDPETGSILFYRKGFQGIPDTVVNGEGYTIELSNGDVVLADIYDAALAFSQLASQAMRFQGFSADSDKTD